MPLANRPEGVLNTDDIVLWCFYDFEARAVISMHIEVLWMDLNQKTRCTAVVWCCYKYMCGNLMCDSHRVSSIGKAYLKNELISAKLWKWFLSVLPYLLFFSIFTEFPFQHWFLCYSLPTLFFHSSSSFSASRMRFCAKSMLLSDWLFLVYVLMVCCKLLSASSHHPRGHTGRSVWTHYVLLRPINTTCRMLGPTF